MAAAPANGRRRGLPAAATAGTLAVALGTSLLGGCRASSEAPAPTSGEGSPTTAAASPATPPARERPLPRSACELVTQAEVEAAIGAPVGAGLQEVEEGRSLCSFRLVTGADESVAVIATSAPGVPASFDAARRNAPSARPVDAGDEAFVNGGQALVRKADTMVVVLVVLRRDPAQLAEAATGLVRLVGGRL